jgi:hypothetical protein
VPGIDSGTRPRSGQRFAPAMRKVDGRFLAHILRGIEGMGLQAARRSDL